MNKTQEVRRIIEQIYGSFNQGMAVTKWGGSNDANIEHLAERLYELRNEIEVTSDRSQSESDNRPEGT